MKKLYLADIIVLLVFLCLITGLVLFFDVFPSLQSKLTLLEAESFIKSFYQNYNNQDFNNIYHEMTDNYLKKQMEYDYFQKVSQGSYLRLGSVVDWKNMDAEYQKSQDANRIVLHYRVKRHKEDTFDSFILSKVKKKWFLSQYQIFSREEDDRYRFHSESHGASKPGQVIAQKEDLQKLKNGFYKEFYEDGALKSEIHYVHGEKEGICKSYYQNGNLKEEGFFKRGKLNGQWKFYFEMGAVKGEESYRNDKKHGSFRKFFPEGAVHIEGQYLNGKIDKKYTEYYPDGKIETTGNYSQGKRSGCFELFNESGVLKSKHCYGDTKKDPIIIDYFK